MTTLEHASQNAADGSHRHVAPDRQQIRAAVQLLAAGLISGLALHVLVWDRAGGSLGWLLSTIIIVACSVFLNLKQDGTWRREQWVWFAVMLAAVGMTVFRDALEVRVLMVFVMLLALGVMFYRSHGHGLLDATVARALLMALRMPARMLAGIVNAVDTLIRARWHGAGRIQAIVRGVLLAAPLLLIFTGLFASADAVFSNWMDSLGDVVSALTPHTPLISFVLTIIATGLLSCTIHQPATAAGQMDQQSRLPRLGRDETAILLGSLATLFVIFVVLQLSWLFGGQELIQARSGLTLADYARRGFFELVVVAGLTLAVLMSVSAMQGHQQLLRMLGGIMIGCVLVMLVSALHRLHLYIDQFGMTMDRLMALALVLWLAFALVCFAATVLRGSLRGFVSALLIAGIVISLALALLNPAKRVALINIAHAQSSGQMLDVDYLISLDSDAITPLLMASDSVELNADQWARIMIQHRTDLQSGESDWRDWNASRARASMLIQERLTQNLEAMLIRP